AANSIMSSSFAAVHLGERSTGVQHDACPAAREQSQQLQSEWPIAERQSRDRPLILRSAPANAEYIRSRHSGERTTRREHGACATGYQVQRVQRNQAAKSFFTSGV